MELEPKFRAWDCKNKKFAFEGFHVIGEVTLFSLLPQYSLEELVKLEVTEWTRRKDINGKDIYEKDIVKQKLRRFDWNKPDGEEMYFEEVISFIEFVGNGFWVHDEGFGWEGEDLWNWDNLEVIGNLYENAELIK
jgi:uncharacterized phage protein (TIGR01671 family)